MTGRGGRMMTKMATLMYYLKGSDGNDFLRAPLIHGLKTKGWSVLADDYYFRFS